MNKKRNILRELGLPFCTGFTPVIKFIYALICAAVTVYLSEKIVRADSMSETPNVFYNWLRSDIGDFAFWITVIAVFFAISTISLITTKISVGVFITGALMMVSHSVHYYKMTLRGEPFYPWDIFQAGEATNIMGEVKIEFTSEVWLGIAGVIVMSLAGLVIDLLFRYPRCIRWFYRLGVGVVTVFCLAGYMNGVLMNESLMAENGIKLVLWEEAESYEKNGFFITFALNAKKMQIEEPDGYTAGDVTGIAEGYTKSDGDTPNIIIIMSEAFADPDQYSAVEYDRELTPNIDAIRSESLTGNLLTPSYGGGTSISEYEVLTGNCASYLPSGTVPYMQYVTGKTDSYASFLKELGYSTLAIHPYEADFWCRNKAYPLMGFDRFLSEDDFSDCDYPRNLYISDMDLTHRIIAEYEAAGDAPFFAFCVSMQNHASYGYWDKYEDPVRLVGDDKAELYEALGKNGVGAVESYATGIYLADEALGALVDYFRDVDRETVIIFFGDHQPHLGDVDLSLLGFTTASNSSEENTYLKYTTPYIVWNNYGAGEAAVADMSMYQLLPYTTEALGLSRPAYFELLSDMRETVAGHTNLLTMSPDGTLAKTPSEEQAALLRDHWLVQYDNMFGRDFAGLWK